MGAFVRLIYRFVLLPLLFLGALTASLFSVKIRKTFFKRIAQLKHLKHYQNHSQKIIYIHCASFGEFEHIKPLIHRIHSLNTFSLVVSFYSPSGYENFTAYPGVSQFIYLPIDFNWVWKRFYTLLKPSLVLISKHDLWHGQVHMAQRLNIPVYLINGSLGKTSSRLNPFSRYFFRQIYLKTTQIFSISEADKGRFKRYFPGVNVENVGDTKFDQVIERKKLAQKTSLLPSQWLQNKTIMILGSVWNEGLTRLNPVIKDMIQNNRDIKIIIAPHKPSPNFIHSISNFYGSENCALYNEGSFSYEAPILIVDKVGILADLYQYAHIAYVGGGFKQGVHNIMEAAVYGIPVFYGPINQNASEAERFAKAGGGKIVENSNDIRLYLTQLISDRQLRKSIGNNASLFVKKHAGASDRIMKRLKLED
jgi:3-deoxy-D-manno-octulosonic-acid transferase